MLRRGLQATAVHVALVAQVSNERWGANFRYGVLLALAVIGACCLSGLVYHLLGL
jgi:hypothetical protein